MNFNTLYKKAPISLKSLIDKTKSVEQSPHWHSEGNVYTHTELVTNRLEIYDDINLSLSGLFHDLGKLNTTIWNKKKGSWTAHNHEVISAKYVDMYSIWINGMGGDTKIIKDVVLNHMRVKFIDDMKYSKKIKLVSNPNFDLIRKFQTADYGGFGDKCKEPIDITYIQEQIKKQKKNILQRLFDTFYIKGRFIMKKDKYFIFKTTKPHIVKVKNGIEKSNRFKIKL